MKTMLYLSQRDVLWCTDRIGSSLLQVGRWGCTLTCISMLSSYFDCYKSPSQIAHNVANFTNDGLVNWQKLAFPKMRFVERTYREDSAKILEAMKNPDKAVMLQVNFGQHWVVAVRKSLLGNDYIVVDPWTGKKVGAKAMYRNITGAAYFERIK